MVTRRSLEDTPAPSTAFFATKADAQSFLEQHYRIVTSGRTKGLYKRRGHRKSEALNYYKPSIIRLEKGFVVRDGWGGCLAKDGYFVGGDSACRTPEEQAEADAQRAQEAAPRPPSARTITADRCNEAIQEMNGKWKKVLDDRDVEWKGLVQQHKARADEIERNYEKLKGGHAGYKAKAESTVEKLMQQCERPAAPPQKSFWNRLFGE